VATITQMMLSTLIRPATGELWLKYLDDAKKLLRNLNNTTTQTFREEKALSVSENARDL